MSHQNALKLVMFILRLEQIIGCYSTVVLLKKSKTKAVLFDTEIGETEPNVKAHFIKHPLNQFLCASCFFMDSSPGQ